MTLKPSKIGKKILFLGFSIVFLYAGEQQEETQASNFMRVAADYLKRSEFDSSIFYFQKAGDIVKSENTITYLQSQIGISNCLLRKGEYNNAITVLLSAEQIGSTEQLKRSAETGTIYTLLGYCYLVREEFDSAEKYASESVKILIENFGETHEKVASAYYTWGLVLKAKGNYAAGISHLMQALQIQLALPKIGKSSIANTLTMLGAVYENKNEVDRAIEYYQKADSILRCIGQQNSLQAASCYLNLMSSYNDKGEYRKALLYGKKVTEIYTSLALLDDANMASALSKIGEIYTHLGDYEKAEEYLIRSLIIFTSKHTNKKSAIGAIYQLLGDIYNRTGNIEKAISYSKKGMELYEQVFGEEHPQTGFMYELLADVYVKAKQYNNAIHYYEKALIARQRVIESSSRSDIALLHTSIANVYLVQRQYDSSLIHLQTALVIEASSTGKNVLQMSLVRQRFGDFYYQQRKYSQALQYYHSALCILAQVNGNTDERSIPNLHQSIYKKEMLELLLSKALVLEKLYLEHGNVSDLRVTFEHYQKAMDELDELRKQYLSDASKYYLAETGSLLYRRSCRIALALYATTKEQHFQEMAFLIADRSKGNILLERLNDSEAKHFANIPDSLLEQEQELLSAIAQYETQMSRDTVSNPNQRDVTFSIVQGKYLESKRKHQDLVELLEQQFPKYYELKYAQYSLTLNALQSRLEPKTVLVEYMVDDSVIYLFAVTKMNLIVKTLKNADAIQSLTNRFSASLKSYDTETYSKIGFDLYSSVLRPIETTMSTMSKIMIIPDGFLFYIPFEALPTNRNSRGSIDFTKMNYIVSQYDVTYAYSAAFNLKLYEEDRNDASTVSSFIGFAPVFKDTMKNGDFFANRSYIQQSGISDVRSITLDGKKFNELKYSEDEVVSIESTWKQHAVATKNFLYESASEKNFKTFAPLYDVVHIATHGFINENNPKLSAILFSQPKTSAEVEDGILYVNETFSLKLKAKLVVLSSCESGVGMLVDGEGMIALSRGLFYAGAKNIIFSLWKISDKQTYLLMDEFYKNIASGKSYSSSLRSAKLSMIRSKESAFPGKWSGFVLIGK